MYENMIDASKFFELIDNSFTLKLTGVDENKSPVETVIPVKVEYKDNDMLLTANSGEATMEVNHMELNTCFCLLSNTAVSEENDLSDLHVNIDKIATLCADFKIGEFYIDRYINDVNINNDVGYILTEEDIHGMSS